MFYYIKPMMYPVLLIIVLVPAVLGPYFQAKKEGTIGDSLPFISQTGVYGVAAAIFTLLFSLYAFISYIIITWRFEQVKAKYDFREYRCLSVANMIIYGIGLVACVGVLLLANFRLDYTNNTLVITHNIGTIGAFGLGLVYFTLQSIFSFIWRDIPGSRLWVNIIRAVLSVMHTVFFTAYIVIMTSFRTSSEMMIVAPIFQWIYAFLITIYSVTFIPEFCRIDIKFVINSSTADRNNEETIPLQDY